VEPKLQDTFAPSIGFENINTDFDGIANLYFKRMLPKLQKSNHTQWLFHCWLT